MLQSEVTTSLAPLVKLVEPWQSLYAGNSAVSTAVLFVHLSAMVTAAGLAVANDRAIIRTSASDGDGRERRLTDFAASHRTVLSALSVSFVSGILLFLADLEAFVVMPLFWVKLSLILLLMVNASFMVRREQQLRQLTAVPIPSTPAVISRSWSRMRGHAMASLTLWFAIVLAGTAMTSA